MIEVRIIIDKEVVLPIYMNGEEIKERDLMGVRDTLEEGTYLIQTFIDYLGEDKLEHYVILKQKRQKV